MYVDQDKSDIYRIIYRIIYKAILAMIQEILVTVKKFYS